MYESSKTNSYESGLNLNENQIEISPDTTVKEIKEMFWKDGFVESLGVGTKQGEYDNTVIARRRVVEEAIFDDDLRYTLSQFLPEGVSVCSDGGFLHEKRAGYFFNFKHSPDEKFDEWSDIEIKFHKNKISYLYFANNKLGLVRSFIAPDSAGFCYFDDSTTIDDVKKFLKEAAFKIADVPVED